MTLESGAPNAASYVTVLGRCDIHGDFVPLVAIVGNYESIAVMVDDPRDAKEAATVMYGRLHPRRGSTRERVDDALRDVRHGPTP